ncbi:hypothetical protein GLOIN_2v1777499 [Rhizophagus irregularis DAOM 181602=DAOM 197198]|nr:hypothetical protein GLOIN_2v1777499 [Rhizophagus irregularis DAOM 181602=DAOM 197198]
MSNEELTKEQLFIKPYLLGYYRSFVGLELEYLRDFYKAEEKKEHISLAEYETNYELDAWKEKHNKLEESVKVLKEEKKFADEQIISLEKEKKIADKQIISLEKNIKKAEEQIISLENGVRKFKDLEKNKSKTKSHDW